MEKVTTSVVASNAWPNAPSHVVDKAFVCTTEPLVTLHCLFSAITAHQTAHSSGNVCNKLLIFSDPVFFDPLQTKQVLFLYSKSAM